MSMRHGRSSAMSMSNMLQYSTNLTKIIQWYEYGTKSKDTHHDTAIFLHLPVVVLPHLKFES